MYVCQLLFVWNRGKTAHYNFLILYGLVSNNDKINSNYARYLIQIVPFEIPQNTAHIDNLNYILTMVGLKRNSW
jgi:hypothetical protein